MTPAHDVVRGEPVDVTTADGITLHAHWHPAASPVGAVLLLPAIATPARSLKHLAHALSQRGLHVLRADYRFMSDRGPHPSRRHDADMRAILDRDVPALLQAVTARANGAPVACAGHSLGGQLSALALAEHASVVKAAVLITVAMPFDPLWAWPRRAGPWAAFRLFPAMARVLGHMPARPLGLGARTPATLIRDWGRWGRTGRYHSGGLDLSAVLSRVEGPVLALGATDDHLYGPEKAMQFYEAMMPRARLTRMRLSPREAGVETLGHFGMLWPPAADVAAERMSTWLRGVLA